MVHIIAAQEPSVGSTRSATWRRDEAGRGPAGGGVVCPGARLGSGAPPQAEREGLWALALLLHWRARLPSC